MSSGATAWSASVSTFRERRKQTEIQCVVYVSVSDRLHVFLPVLVVLCLSLPLPLSMCIACLCDCLLVSECVRLFVWLFDHQLVCLVWQSIYLSLLCSYCFYLVHAPQGNIGNHVLWLLLTEEPNKPELTKPLIYCSNVYCNGCAMIFQIT